MVNEVIFTEGIVDAILLSQMGFPAVSKNIGAGGWYPEWASYFRFIDKIYMLFDNDEAGRKGMKKGAEVLGIHRCKGYTFEDFELNWVTDLTPSRTELFANSPENNTFTALHTSLSDIVFFFAISVSLVAIKDISFAAIHNALLSCCLELDVIPFTSAICFRTLELFQVPYSLDDVWKHYAKYHFGWVRGYFDGYTWHILPSGVTSV